MPQRPNRLPLMIRLWLLLTAVLPGLPALAARVLHRRMQAAPARFAERLGHAPMPRPQGRLVWLHAASVGEVVSAARLVRQITAKGGPAVLVTTTTATGSATVARLLPGVTHQFLPIDTPAAIRRFLDHWRPDAALFVEGDLWPRLILTLQARGCPLVLLNARASRSRARHPAVSAALLAPMRLITLQDPALGDDFLRLGVQASCLIAPGNLKADIDTPPVDPALGGALARAAQGRGIWAAVSTHAGEESLLLDVQKGLAGRPLLILVPRHPDRAASVIDDLNRSGLAFTRHSSGQRPDARTDVHLVDALGLTGTVYAAAGLAFIGGSLVAGPGGHTPFEPVALGCGVLTGPHVGNFTSAYAALQAVGAARPVADAAGLAQVLAELLADPAARAALQAAALRAHAAQGGATLRTHAALTAALPGVFAGG